MRKLCSKMILDLKKCPNKKTHESESVGFRVWALPKVKIISESIFLIKCAVCRIYSMIPYPICTIYIVHMGGTSQEGKRPKKWEFYTLRIGFS